MRSSVQGPSELTLSSDSLPELLRKGRLPLISLQKVDVDVESAADAICDGFGELIVCGALLVRRRVDERFAVRGMLAYRVD